METGPHPSPKSVEAPLWIRVLYVPVLFLNTIVSSIILVGLQNHWTIHGDWYRKINHARATTQIVVQIVSGLLGTLYVQTLCTLVNFYVRIALTRSPMTLDKLKFWNAVTAYTPDWTLRIRSLIVVLAWYSLALIPSALWAGALTPVQSSSSYSLPGAISAPRYTQATRSYWAQNIYTHGFLGNVSQGISEVVNPKGTFSYLPIQDRIGYLISDGSSATSVNDQPTQHTKNDNSNYTFVGRSYGVGSSVGLKDGPTNKIYGTTGYSYTETGYLSTVSCIHNSSSQFALSLITQGEVQPLWETPSLFLATGPGPNTTQSTTCTANNLTECGGFVTAGLGNGSEVTAAAWWASAESGNAGNGLPQPYHYLNTKRPPRSKAYTALTAGSSFSFLNNTQCSIEMVPTSFKVVVSSVSRSIQVTPYLSITDVQDIEPSGFIADIASSILGVMSSVETTLHTSVIGIMLQRNIANVRQQRNDSQSQAGWTQPGLSETLQGVADTLQVLIDDHLLATASAQLMVANDSFPEVATISQVAFTIGERSYSIAVVAMNAVVVLAFIFEAVRTRIWTGMTRFDYTNIKDVIIGASFGTHELPTSSSAITARTTEQPSVQLKPYDDMTLTLSSSSSGPRRAGPFWNRGGLRGRYKPHHKQNSSVSYLGEPLMEYSTVS